MKQKLRVKQIKSCIGVDWRFRLNLQGLGLGRIGKTVEVANTPSFRGAIKKVLHLVTVEEI
ncbi:MAG: 50S ribosomal protein L30 [Myxococcales bacterium 68-20]|nr:50S ribosomal protein L30 [Myxococcales bacterium]OJY21127.1 MAG: 50S ribosomal protein L30 [Myxococcales bacterium 68-20]